ncbi:MAG: hypothetical protein QOG13_1354 [Sphingomonadales bacterium]|nr:hypothetical protein [Sphingomonadales bacterium]
MAVGGIKMDCIAVVALLCLNEPAAIEVEASSVWSGAHITIGDVRITSVVSSDYMPGSDWRRMQRQCVGTECLYYHLYCAPDDGRYNCNLNYVRAGDEYSRDLELSAGTQEELWATYDRLGVIFPGGDTPVPLSLMRRTSPERNVPFCRRREDPGCRPSAATRTPPAGLARSPATLASARAAPTSPAPRLECAIRMNAQGVI